MLDVVAEEMSVLIVIDEILKGTNTRERVAASKAILDYIGSTECLALVATHDNELTATVRFGSKAANAQGSIDLCRKVIADQAFGQMDVNYYMEYIKEEETNGKIFAKIDDFLVDLSTFTKFDYFVGGGFGGLVAVFETMVESTGNDNLVYSLFADSCNRYSG